MRGFECLNQSGPLPQTRSRKQPLLLLFKGKDHMYHRKRCSRTARKAVKRLNSTKDGPIKNQLVTRVIKDYSFDIVAMLSTLTTVSVARTIELLSDQQTG